MSLPAYQISTRSVHPFPNCRPGNSSNAWARRHPAPDSSRGLGWWVSSHIQIWARSANSFPSYNTECFATFPHSACAYHALLSTPRSIEVGFTHGRRNGATHDKKPFVKRTCGCWDISLKIKRVTTASRPLIPTYLCYYHRDNRALPRPLIISTLRNSLMTALGTKRPLMTSHWPQNDHCCKQT